MTKQRKQEIADWVVDTCLLFGTSIGTAYQVAVDFVKALEAEEKPRADL